MKISRRCFCAASAMLSASAWAVGKWPSRPVKLIVPFPPGGGNDAIARFIADNLSKEFGQPFIVDNRAGAGGLIGVEAGVGSTPDGYTLTLVSPSYTISPAIYTLKFDPTDDVSPIVKISSGALVVVSSPRMPVESLREFIQYAKSKPGRVNFGSSGQGSVPHLAAELFARKVAIKMIHVPYKGGGPALNDVAAGHVDLCFSPLPAAKAMIDAGKVKALAVSTDKPIAALPKIPTIAYAAGVRYDVELWHGLLGPKGLPSNVVRLLNEAINKILALPEATKRLAVDGVMAAGGSAQDFSALLSSEILQWQSLVRETKVKVE